MSCVAVIVSDDQKRWCGRQRIEWTGLCQRRCPSVPPRYTLRHTWYLGPDNHIFIVQKTEELVSRGSCCTVLLSAVQISMFHESSKFFIGRGPCRRPSALRGRRAPVPSSCLPCFESWLTTVNATRITVDGAGARTRVAKAVLSEGASLGRDCSDNSVCMVEVF